MNYLEIKDTALLYADRAKDTEVLSRIDAFLRITESRINRRIKVQDMAIRTTINMVKGQEYYGLPQDFAGLRDIEIRSADTLVSDPKDRVTLQYLTPEQMNNVVAGHDSGMFYSIIADQLQVSSPQDGKTLEIVYYRKLVPLTADEAINWVSADSPDLYIFGILVEIAAFVKNAETSTLWDARFTTTLDELVSNDAVSRWSGTSMQMRLG